MKALELTVTPQNHMVRLPSVIPDGRPVRLVILMNEEYDITAEEDIKEVLSSVAEGLSDEDLQRVSDYGREISRGISD